MLSKVDDDGSFLKHILFTDEVTFHVNGCAIVIIPAFGGSQQSTEIIHEYVCCSPKVKV